MDNVYSGCACNSGAFFIGSSRTELYYATEFEDWCKELGENNSFIRDTKCMGYRSQYKQCLELTDGNEHDYAYTYYYHYAMSMPINQGSLKPRIWVDPVSHEGGAVPFVDCAFGDNICEGGSYGQISHFVNKVEQYYSGLNPFPYKGFVYDFYGMVGQGPGYDPGGGNCDYCGGGLATDCCDPYFGWRGFESKVFLFDKSVGIPYVYPDKLTDYYKANKFYDSFPIKTTHIIDENVQVTGKANWNKGDITHEGIGLYAKYLPSFTSSTDFNRATITTATGGANGQVNSTSFIDLPVKLKTCKQYPEYKKYPWIYVDIPDGLTPEVTDNVAYSSFFIVPGEDLMNKALYGNQSWSFHGIGWVIPIIDSAVYFKRYTHKTIKAPHNLYMKRFDTKFTTCALGETLYDLEPGKYFFPNPCYGCAQDYNLSYYDITKHLNARPGIDYPVDVFTDTDGKTYQQYFDTNVAQFYTSGTDDLTTRFQNAVNALGLPWATGTSGYGASIRMEIDPTRNNYLAIEDIAGLLG